MSEREKEVERGQKQQKRTTHTERVGERVTSSSMRVQDMSTRFCCHKSSSAGKIKFKAKTHDNMLCHLIEMENTKWEAVHACGYARAHAKTITKWRVDKRLFYYIAIPW